MDWIISLIIGGAWKIMAGALGALLIWLGWKQQQKTREELAAYKQAEEIRKQDKVTDTQTDQKRGEHEY